MSFHPRLDIRCDPASLNFEYGPGVFGPAPEFRRMNDIRPSLLDPDCEGPDPVYAIAMDVGRAVDRDELHKQRLLFGVVAYAKGRLGRELVRSQGHVHAISPHCGSSTPELIEIWQGKAIVYLQERAEEDPGRCFALEARPGNKVVIPPEWAHCVVNADPNNVMLFGAWCTREYGFDYDAIRARGGLAWFPVYDEQQQLNWQPNPAYKIKTIVKSAPRERPGLTLGRKTPIYEQFVKSPESLAWISQPSKAGHGWERFEP